MGRHEQKRTRAEIINAIEQGLQDTGNLIWDTTEIGVVLDKCLTKLSEYCPYDVRETLATTDGSRDIDIGDIGGLIREQLEECDLEYPVGEYPKELHNFTIFGDTLTMKIASVPGDAETVYLYCRKNHHLDPIWVKETDYVAGQFVAPTTHNGYSYECTTAGKSDSTEPAWPTTAGETVEDPADGDLIWTCRGEEANSLSRNLEDLLVDFTIAKAALSKPVGKVNRVNVGGTRVPMDYAVLGKEKLAIVYSELRSLSSARHKQRYAE